MPSPVTEVLRPGGPIASALTDMGLAYEPRPQQLAMAEAVARAMAARPGVDPRTGEMLGDGRGRHLMAEAGTGVGKSFAYLVPAMLRCILHGERVVVATNTIALQEQLISRDIPLLVSSLDRWQFDEQAARADLHPVLVKGRGNYMSIRRLQLASKRELSMFPDAASRQTLKVIEDWAYTTTDGSLATLPSLDRPAVWDRVQSDAGNCMGRKCPHYRKCFYQRARRDMERGNLLVCNHALFFSDLALRAATGGDAGFLPDYDHIVFDEAHSLEDVACDHFGLSLTESRVTHLLNLLYHHRSGRGYLANAQLGAAGTETLDAAHHAVLNAHDATRAFFDGLASVRRRETTAGGRLHAGAVIEDPLSPAMRSLATRLKSLRETLGSATDDSREEDRFELGSYILRATAIADEAHALVTQSVPGCVYWIEGSDESMDDSSPRGGRGRAGSGGSRPARLRLACSPIEVGPILKKELFSRPCSIVLTSATLSTRRPAADEPAERAETAFAHFSSSIGCDDAHTLHLDSPFDFARQVRLYIDPTMPEPFRGGRRAARAGHRSDDGHDSDASQDPYVAALVDRVLSHVTATDGGAFVLFTSFSMLYACADQIERPMRIQDRPLLVQGRDGSRTALLDAFKQDPRSVLFGAASFWQGVDVRGRSLRNVIITRLPFDPPERPLTEARLDRIKSRGGNSFMEESLPRAIIRFKQGFGRLIRSQTDSGRVVVLDPRIMTARYGRLFLEALPEGVAIETVGEPGDH
ncbi:MAG: hypothetical protein KF745_01080 [Phycisphaeraceae bacterium]|nr:hypothetical protein [Phycisphaeraceae bacterium]